MLKMFASRASAELNRKQAEELLRESEQRYRAFVEMNPDACWRVELEQPIDTSLPEEDQLEKVLQCGYLAECNQAAVERLGLERNQLIGAALPNAVLDMETARRSVQYLIRTGYRHSTLEVNPVDRHGKRHHFLPTVNTSG